MTTAIAEPINGAATLETTATLTHPFIANIFQWTEDYTFEVELMKFLMENFNKENRPLVKSKVIQYSNDMSQNVWNYDVKNPIKFMAQTGYIMDGQHRFAAAIKANKPLRTCVMFGLPANTMIHIDENAPRSQEIRSLLAKGIIPTRDMTRLLSGAFAVVRVWEWAKNGFGAQKRLSVSILDNLYAAKKDVIDRVLIAQPNPDAKRTGYRTACAMYMEKDPIKAQEFFDAVGGLGANLSDTSPVLHLRNYLSRTVGGGNPRQKQDYATTVWMIHRFHNNQPAQRIRQQLEWEF